MKIMSKNKQSGTALQLTALVGKAVGLGVGILEGTYIK